MLGRALVSYLRWYYFWAERDTLHCKDSIVYRKWKQIFQEMKLRGLSPSSYIHVSVSDLYINTIDLPILLQEKRWTDRGNI
jgi:hypothetical protein